MRQYDIKDLLIFNRHLGFIKPPDSYPAPLAGTHFFNLNYLDGPVAIFAKRQWGQINEAPGLIPPHPPTPTLGMFQNLPHRAM